MRKSIRDYGHAKTAQIANPVRLNFVWLAAEQLYLYLDVVGIANERPIEYIPGNIFKQIEEISTKEHFSLFQS